MDEADFEIEEIIRGDQQAFWRARASFDDGVAERRMVEEKNFQKTKAAQKKGL
jgi:hypothetical protein